MLGIARSLAVEFPKDPEAWDITGEFMYGDYLLVAPVLDSAVVSHKVYLPEGTWIDFMKGTSYAGNQYIAYATDKDNWQDIPLFIRKGAILPTQEIQQYVGENEVKMIYLDLFPDQKKTSFPLYDDDGTTYNYEKGDYFRQVISLVESKGLVRIEFGKQEQSRKPAFTHFLAKVHGEPAVEVRVDKAGIRKFGSFEELREADVNGFCITSDIYGKTTCIKLKVKGEGQSVLVQK
jgi:alpha-glucosidase